MATFRQNQQRNVRRVLRNERTTNDAINQVYRQTLDDIRGKLARLYEKYAKGGVLTNAEMTKFNRWRNMERDMSKILRDNSSQVNGLTEKLATVDYNASFFQTQYSIDQAIKANVRWGLVRPEVVRAAVRNQLFIQARRRLSATQIARVNSAIAGGLTRGLSFPNMARGVRDALDISRADAIRIARTEGQRAANLGRAAALDEAEDKGIKMVRRWDATLDDRTRTSHRVMDGRPKDVKVGDEMYYNAIGTEAAPYVKGPQQSGIASFDINCRCVEIAEVEDFDVPVARQERFSAQSYDEWKQGRNIRGDSL